MVNTLDYYVILPHASDTSVLLIRDGNGWTLPCFTADITDFRMAHHINVFVNARYGISSVVQRCLYHCDAPDCGQPYRVYGLENLSPEVKPPPDGQWVSATVLGDISFTISEHQVLVRTWLQDAIRDTVSPLRSPWATSGWFAAASSWVQMQLERLNITALGPVVQEKSWVLSCIMRIETSVGRLYFKAVPSFIAQEAVVMREMARLHPNMMPSPFAIDIDQGWMLMPDFGGEFLLYTSDVRRWEEALQMCARMQVVQADHVQDWLEWGCPDRNLTRMVELIDPLMTISTQIFSDSMQGLSAVEVEGLLSLSLKMKLLCANLSSYKVPPTLVHGDLGGNILVTDDRYIFFDWTDVCIAHPFFDMATIIQEVFDGSVLEHEPNIRTRLRNAYLEPWTKYEPMERLIQAFEVSTSLGALHQAMSYMWLLMNVEERTRWELESGLLLWLRRVLRLLPPGA